MYNRQKNYNFADENRQVAQNYVQFRPDFHHNQEPNLLSSDYHDSGESSPPLWKINSPSPPKSPSHPLLGRHNRRRSSSPESRAEAIARGQWELMEMVKNMPESSYELTLRDLVEVETDPVPKIEELRILENKNQSLHQRAKVKRQENFESRGVALKMVFPFSLKSKKKRNFNSNSTGKVSPRPDLGPKGGGGGGGGAGGGGERDWWKKKFTGSSDSDSSRISGSSGGVGSSGSSGSSGGGSGSSGSRRSHGAPRKRNGFKCGGCLFFQPRKSNSVE